MRHVLHKPSHLSLRCYLPGSAILLAFLVLFTPLPAAAEYGDVVLNNLSEKAGERPVIFSHWFHRIRFRCKVCHTEMGFQMKAGADKVTMTEIVKGRYCGMCHNGEVAWGPKNCFLCHSGKSGLETGIRGGEVTGGPGIW